MAFSKIDTVMVSIMDTLTVTGAHKIQVIADKLYSEIDYKEADLLFLPGGGTGTKNLKAHKELADALLDFAADDTKRIAAICAAPSVLGSLGILKGKKATCYPGFEDQLLGAKVVTDGVVTDGRITTAKGMGVSIELGLELIKLLIDKETADTIKEQIQCN